MRTLRAALLRLAGLFRRQQGEREFAAEIDSHLRIHIEENLRAGMSLEQARRNALMKLGGVEQTKELYREVRNLQLLETILQDFRYAMRTLRKNPGFATIAVLTLALGIGANTAMFSMVNALLLHPYNFPELDRLVIVWENRGIDEGVEARFIAASDAAELEANTQVFDGLTLFRCGDLNLSRGGDVQSVLGCSVSVNFFDVLGATPASGRTFTPDEARPGADQAQLHRRGNHAARV